MQLTWNAYLNVNGRWRGSNAGFPALRTGEGRPTLGWGRMPKNFDGVVEGQACIRQQRMSAAADVLGQYSAAAGAVEFLFTLEVCSVTMPTCK
ncbi:hypothetical protein NtRootA9_07510 [Arthrobacter sp. NtRootA9]|nr:hypothetical protein NtRootA9_07510 [Arthrobacter sp. NtRootA9]